MNDTYSMKSATSSQQPFAKHRERMKKSKQSLLDGSQSDTFSTSSKQSFSSSKFQQQDQQPFQLKSSKFQEQSIFQYENANNMSGKRKDEISLGQLINNTTLQFDNQTTFIQQQQKDQQHYSIQSIPQEEILNLSGGASVSQDLLNKSGMSQPNSEKQQSQSQKGRPSVEKVSVHDVFDQFKAIKQHIETVKEAKKEMHNMINPRQDLDQDLNPLVSEIKTAIQNRYKLLMNQSNIDNSNNADSISKRKKKFCETHFKEDYCMENKTFLAFAEMINKYMNQSIGSDELINLLLELLTSTIKQENQMKQGPDQSRKHSQNLGKFIDEIKKNQNEITPTNKERNKEIQMLIEHLLISFESEEKLLILEKCIPEFNQTINDYQTLKLKYNVLLGVAIKSGLKKLVADLQKDSSEVSQEVHKDFENLSNTKFKDEILQNETKGTPSTIDPEQKKAFKESVKEIQKFKDQLSVTETRLKDVQLQRLQDKVKGFASTERLLRTKIAEVESKDEILITKLEEAVCFGKVMFTVEPLIVENFNSLFNNVTKELELKMTQRTNRAKQGDIMNIQNQEESFSSQLDAEKKADYVIDQLLDLDLGIIIQNNKVNKRVYFIKVVHYNEAEKSRDIYLMSVLEDQILKWEGCLDLSENIKQLDTTYQFIKHRLIRQIEISGKSKMQSNNQSTYSHYQSQMSNVDQNYNSNEFLREVIQHNNNTSFDKSSNNFNTAEIQDEYNEFQKQYSSVRRESRMDKITGRKHTLISTEEISMDKLIDNQKYKSNESKKNKTHDTISENSRSQHTNISQNQNSKLLKLKQKEKRDKMMQDFMKALKELTLGYIFLKYGQRGKPKQRHVYLLDNGKKLGWKDPGAVSPKAFILIPEIVRILDGRETKKFKRFKKASDQQEKLSFSLQTDKRTLDLEAATLLDKEEFLANVSLVMIMGQQKQMQKQLRFEEQKQKRDMQAKYEVNQEIKEQENSEDDEEEESEEDEEQSVETKQNQSQSQYEQESKYEEDDEDDKVSGEEEEEESDEDYDDEDADNSQYQSGITNKSHLNESNLS